MKHLSNGHTQAGKDIRLRSFIVILDTVAPTGDTLEPIKGQVVRNEDDLRRIFDNAGLSMHKCSAMTELHEDYHPVKVWALHEHDEQSTISDTELDKN